MTLTDRQIRSEEKEFRKLQKIIEKKATRELDKWTKKWLREERKENKKYLKSKF